MPSIFIHEHMVATNTQPECSKYREGKAMWEAISSDFEKLQGTVVNRSEPGSYLESSRGIETDHADQCRARFIHQAEHADYTLVIAPDSNLREYCEWLGLTRSRSLNCECDAISLASDKMLTYLHWRNHAVRTPHSLMLDRSQSHLQELQGWRVLKNRYGAGSDYVRLVKSVSELQRELSECQARGAIDLMMQDYVAGRAASIAFLAGPQQILPLRATIQWLSDDGQFHYQGGMLPLNQSLEDRVIEIGRRAVGCIPGLHGYVGVDVVLAATSESDTAIEINPRLTTSYVGLRALADFNIAQAMMDIIVGRDVDYIRWKPGRVQFRPEGLVEYDPTPGAWFE